MVDNDEGGRQCLHGTRDDETGEYNGRGALRRMHGRVPQWLVKWPSGVEEPDHLTKAQYDRMIETAELYIP
jgi:hypothetical protein